jgi:hypothetical protein
MEEIRIKLWWDGQAQDWHIEINGLRHMHLPPQTIEDLVEATVIRAENTLIEQATRRGLYRPN